MSPLIVLVGGGHAAGKLSAVTAILQELRLRSSELKPVHVECIDLTEFQVAESSNREATRSVVLKPSRFDFAKLQGRLVSSANANLDSCVVLVHGIYALYNSKIRDMAHLKVFIDGDPDTRLIRMIRKQVLGNGDALQHVLSTYLQGYRDEMRNFIFSTKEFADVIIPNGAEPQSIRLILDGILPILSAAGPTPIARVHTPQNNLRPRLLDNVPPSEFYQLN